MNTHHTNPIYDCGGENRRKEMKKRKIAAITMAVMTFSLLTGPISGKANELEHEKVIQSMENQERAKSQLSETRVSKFDVLQSSYLEEYNNSFQLDNAKITSITNNGGHYGSSVISKAIDGKLNTHWETGRSNRVGFVNEVVLTLDEVTILNRIVYGARQDISYGKGFAREFEVYTSLTEQGDDFELVSQGEYQGNTKDIIEIKFNPTKFKRVKFKFKNAVENWASASEFMLLNFVGLNLISIISFVFP